MGYGNFSPMIFVKSGTWYGRIALDGWLKILVVKAFLLVVIQMNLIIYLFIAILIKV